jgi:hypothetical protein
MEQDARRQESRERLLGDPQIRERIAIRAFELHEMRNREAGKDMDDWLQAENEILNSLVDGELAANQAQAASGNGDGRVEQMPEQTSEELPRRGVRRMEPVERKSAQAGGR